MTDPRTPEAADRLQLAVEELLDRADLDPDRTRAVLAEMAVALEELRMADEEVRVQAEELAASAEAIDLERARYAELFDLAPDAYVETDASGKVVEANQAAQQLLGVPLRHLVGKLLVSFVVADERRAFRALLRQAPGRAVGEQRLTIRSRQGEVRPTGVTLSAHAGLDGRSLRLRWILRDLSDRIRLEAQVEHLTGEVELLDSMEQLLGFADSGDPVQRSIEDLLEVAAGVVPAADIGTTIALPELADRRLSRSDRAVRIDEAQAELQLGPCIEAVHGRTIVRGAPDRWPALAARVPLDDLHELVAVPILGGPGPAAGVINVYAAEEVDATAIRHLDRLARQAAHVLRAAALLGASTELVGHLGSALERRGTIDQAKGILMARERCTSDAAFEQMRAQARRERRRIAEVAAEIVATAVQPSVDS